MQTSRKCLQPLWFLSILALGCAETVATPAPHGASHEVPIARCDPHHPADAWQIGDLIAIPPEATAQTLRARAGGEGQSRLSWEIEAREADGRAWSAQCRAGSYLSVQHHDRTAVYSEPTAVACDLGQAGDEAFHLELTAAGADEGIGELHDRTGIVRIDRLDLAEEPGSVPQAFVLRHDGAAVAWLRTRPTAKLMVLRDLDAPRQQAVQRAALLILALDTHAAARLEGRVRLAPAWARSFAAERMVSVSGRRR